MSPATLLIRADASAEIGTGHVMRCLALAQAWQDSGGQCIFAMAESTPAVEQRLRKEGMKLARINARVATAEDAARTGDIAREKSAAWIVVDGYRFGSGYQEAIKSAGLRLLFVDDNGHAESYCADLVLNQNLHASADLYSDRTPSTHLLLGTRYAMLRREFRLWRNWQREIPAKGRKVLVTMGGSDPNNLTVKAIEAFELLDNSDVEARVMVGGSNPHLPSIEKMLEKQSTGLIIDAIDVPAQMAWADAAVAGAGTTFWEMCFLGLPAILLVLADNQEGVAAAAGKMGLAWTLGDGLKVSASEIADKLTALLGSSEKRAIQSDRGRVLVDGRGAERVVAFLSELQLRRTTESDCELLWEWANEPTARAASFRNEAVTWDGHKNWFRKKMADCNAILYTATNGDGTPVGAVRYQIEGNRAVTSISLGASFRGRRLGQKVLTIAIERLFHDTSVRFIDAYVKPTNEPSLKLFASGGFVRVEPAVVEGQEAAHFVLEKRL